MLTYLPIALFIWSQIMCTFAFQSTSLAVSHQLRVGNLCATLGAGGTNAAPATICKVDNIPLLDPIPDG